MQIAPLNLHRGSGGGAGSLRLGLVVFLAPLGGSWFPTSSTISLPLVALISVVILDTWGDLYSV